MTYNIPYTVRGWGDEIVTTVIYGFQEEPPDGYTAVVRTGESPVILVPTVALTPVDTTPPEPEPGVYFIGKDGEAWQHFADRADDQRWCVVGYQPIYTWQQVWDTAGGSGITPRRLVPESAPVELPWKGEDVRGCDFVIGTVGNSGRLLIQESILDAGDWTRHAFEPDLAEAMAAALLAAARAAREATP